MLACEGGHLEVVQSLLKTNANPNHEREGTGITALIIAVHKGFSDIVYNNCLSMVLTLILGIKMVIHQFIVL